MEHIQDLVEKVLMDNGYIQTAKAYILYRNERTNIHIVQPIGGPVK